MKQIVSNYSYSPATNVVTLTGVNIDADQLLLIVAPQVGRTLYNFASVTGTVSAGADTRVTLNASTAGLTTTSPLVIFYDDQASTQTVAGTVTANVPLVDATLVGGVTQGIPVYLAGGKDGVVIDEINYINNIPAISGTVTANLANVITINTNGSNFSQRVVSKSQLQFSVVAGAHDPLNFASDYTVFPLKITTEAQGRNLAVDLRTNQQAGGNADLSAISTDATAAFVRTQVVGGSVTIGSLPAISGTVTANLNGYSQTAVSYSSSSVTAIPVALQTNGVYGGTLLAYNGANTYLRVGLDSVGGNSLAFGGSVPVSGTVTIGSLPAISGTVTANASNGSLTTRFGTPTTANTAFATSAVTNANRKYLLIQNVTTGSNVITVGIGFTPTTTQGIQLTAGAGITFESSYIPTGQIFVLSSVTASNFTILEA
jgi:hypothetical protein